MKHRRSWWERFVIGFSCLLVVVLVVSGYTIRFVSEEFSSVNRISGLGVLSEEKPAGEPFNILVVGVDNSEGIDEGDSLLIGRNRDSLLTDTIIVVRVDPASGTAAMMSIPRDLWVSVGGFGVKEKINAALSYGGPQALIKTIQDELGVPINHYAQVNFKGFRNLVDNLDGVPLSFPSPVRDVKTGLSVEQPGCYFLDGQQGLALVRSRSYEVFDGTQWLSDPTGDGGRIARQQLFVERMLSRALSQGARNPFALRSMFEAVKQDIVLDDQFSLDDMLSLASQFRDFSLSNLVKLQVPVVSGWEGEAWVVYLLPEAQQVLDVFRGAAEVPSPVQVETFSPAVVDPFEAIPSPPPSTPAAAEIPSEELTDSIFVPLAASPEESCT